MISYKKFIHLVLPIFLLAVGMNLLRLLMTDVSSYIWMNWNLFLGALPLLFVYLFEKAAKKYQRVLTALAWFFFLPNAVYMVTDLIHLRDVGPEWMLWFDGMMIFLYALVGMYIFAYTMIAMKRFVSEKYSRVFFIGVPVLSSFGVYLGRYIRWNTWDIVTRPFHLFSDIVRILQEHYAEPTFIITMVFFTLFMMVSVWSGKKIFLRETM